MIPIANHLNFVICRGSLVFEDLITNIISKTFIIRLRSNNSSDGYLRFLKKITRSTFFCSRSIYFKLLFFVQPYTWTYTWTVLDDRFHVNVVNSDHYWTFTKMSQSHYHWYILPSTLWTWASKVRFLSRWTPRYLADFGGDMGVSGSRSKERDRKSELVLRSTYSYFWMGSKQLGSKYFKRSQICSHTPSALNAGAKRSGATCHMAMPQCCYLAKGAKRPSHTTKTIKFDRIPFDPCNSIKRFDLCPFDQKNSTYLQPPETW